MTRKAWGRTEMLEAAILTWPEFQKRHPHRSYDSWEVKRRRVIRSRSAARRYRTFRVGRFQIVVRW